MPETTAQTPPALTQDPEEPTFKPLAFPTKDDPKTFDASKVLAAIGLILTVTVILVAILWITIQNLEKRVDTLETDVKVTDVEKQPSASQAAAKIASRTATKSAK
jgi:hypothetical protein